MDIQGCLEKSDLVKSIANNSQNHRMKSRNKKETPSRIKIDLSAWFDCDIQKVEKMSPDKRNMRFYIAL